MIAVVYLLYRELIWYVALTLVSSFWAATDGHRCAFTLAVPIGLEKSRATKRWILANHQWLLLLARAPFYALMLIALLFVHDFEFIPSLVGLLGIGALCGVIRRIFLRNEQKLNFAPGRISQMRFIFKCPNFLLWGWPIVSCMRSKTKGRWVWEFKEMNGYLNSIINVIIYNICFYYFVRL